MAIEKPTPELLASLVDRCGRPLLQMAARVMGNVTEAEDVLQDAWSRALGSLARNEFDNRSRIETWLYRVVLTSALNARRERSRRKARDASWPSGGEGKQSEGELAVALREVSVLLAELPDDQASALVLKHFQGLTAREIAEVLETTEGAVEQLLVRARAGLRRRLDHD